jgi:excinuclease ABC subunit C
VQTIFATIATKFAPEKFTADIVAATTPTKGVEQSYTQASADLEQLLGTNSHIRTIDCFDISHFQSQSIVGSCVRFTDGKPDKNKFRRFKIQSLTQQNDYAALQEIVSRRYKDASELPDLMLIDGGKGQLSAITSIFPNAPIVSLAKREETLFAPHLKEGVVLDVKTDMGKLLIALRDYAHHFAISYHRLRRSKTAIPNLISSRSS